MGIIKGRVAHEHLQSVEVLLMSIIYLFLLGLYYINYTLLHPYTMWYPITKINTFEFPT